MNMISEIIGNNYAIYLMAAFFVIGIASRVMLNMIYHNLQRDVNSMPTPKSRILKQIKLKYESCDRLDMQINNTEAFVKKNLSEYRVCGISLRAIEKFLGQAMFFGILIGATAAVFSAVTELERRVVIVHIATTVLGAALLYNYDRLSDISFKADLIETGLVDFLENHLQMHFLAQERIENDNLKSAEPAEENKVIEFVANGRKNVPEDVFEDIFPEIKITEFDEEEESAIDDNKIIEEVLKEFFG